MQNVKPPKHPAQTMWTLALLLLVFTLVFGIFSSFFPAWSRMGTNEAAAITAALAGYPAAYGALATSNSRLFMGHWQNMFEVNDVLKTYIFTDVDTFEQATSPPDFGDTKCRGWLFASRTLELIGWGLAFLALILVVLVIMSLGKWMKKAGWKPPKGPALLAIILTLLAFGCLLTAWIAWIVLAEHGCRNAGTLRNPIQGYSYSFVTACFASGMALLALLCMCLGFTKLKKPVYAPEPKAMYQDPYPEYYTEAPPMYPAYPEYPVQEQMYAAPPVYMQEPIYPPVIVDQTYYAPATNLYNSPLAYPTVPY